MTQRLTCHTTTERDEERETGRKKFGAKQHKISTRRNVGGSGTEKFTLSVVIMHNTRRGELMESEIFTSFLNYDFAFVNYGHVIDSAQHTAKSRRARSSKYRKRKWTARKNREIPSFSCELNGTMRKKSWHWHFKRYAKRTDWRLLHIRTRSAAVLTKANSVARTGFRGSANYFLIKHVLCAVTRLDGGSSQCRSSSPCINIHLNFKTLSAINTTAAFPLLSHLSLPL